MLTDHEINADNWTGEMVMIPVDDEAQTFEVNGEAWRLVEEDSGVEGLEQHGIVGDGYGRIGSVCRLDGFGDSWTAIHTGSDIARDDADPCLAAAKLILSVV